MTLDELRDRLSAFAEERDWLKFHTPRNLALALGGEVGELMELLQWLTDAEVTEFQATPAGGQALGEELADIVIYTMRLADVLGLDLVTAIDRKIEDNAKRYPADRVRGSASKQPGLPD